MPPHSLLPLAGLQNWMQACIRAPQELSAEDQEAVRDRILPSRFLSSLERLEVYRGMYELRLIEALRVDYPGLAHFLGSELFEELARMYVSAHPSRSYTLNRLGDRLPDYVSIVDGLPRPKFVRALATLELAETLVFDDAESPSAPPDSLNGFSETQWDRLRFEPIAALRLLRLDYPAHRYMEAFRKKLPVPAIRPKKTYLAVYRRDYAIESLSLSIASMNLLEALVAGLPLGDALERSTPQARETEIFGWFREWFSHGLFQRVLAD